MFGNKFIIRGILNLLGYILNCKRKYVFIAKSELIARFQGPEFRDFLMKVR